MLVVLKLPVVRRMVIVKQGVLPQHLTVLDPTEYTRDNKTVPTYLDRSDDVAWMLGCTLLIFTMQVRHSSNIQKIDRKYFGNVP